jgi:phytoene dehydrogenase-like protein
MRHPDAIIVGSGPNGLAAAIAIAQAGRSVLVYEAEPTIGGSARSLELTLPGFVHDVCSAVHPFGAVSPFFRTLPLARFGLEWIEPPVQLAHPLDNERAGALYRALDRTATELDGDAGPYRRLIGPVVDDWDRLEPAIFGPIRWPRHPIALARFGLHALGSFQAEAKTFETERARALLAGVAAHSMLPLDRRPTAGFALVFAALAHVAGWVLARGGTQSITDALVRYLESMGGRIVVGSRVTSIDELPPARAVLCDLSPKPLLQIAGHRLPGWYRRKLERYRYGMAAFKVDYALAAPVPWRDPECARSATVHLGGTAEEIALSERESWAGRLAERPMVLLAQPTLFDPTRAPEGRHIVWAYCHVPKGCDADVAPRIEAQIERFAPGFRDRVLARSVMSPADLERHNANLVDGDIGAGAADLGQFFTRPTWRTYATPARGLYICSASTPPGAGVHGMCGFFAAGLALKQVLRD